MNHRKYNMTCKEMNDYISSLSHEELKEFQLDDINHEIEISKIKMYISIGIFIGSLFSIVFLFKELIVVFPIIVAISFLFHFFYMRAKYLGFKMMKSFMQEFFIFEGI